MLCPTVRYEMCAGCKWVPQDSSSLGSFQCVSIIQTGFQTYLAILPTLALCLRKVGVCRGEQPVRGGQRALSSLHCLVKLQLWRAHPASTAARGVDGVERCWGSCCPHSFHLFWGSKPISQRIFPPSPFTFHVRFIHRLVHPSPLGNALPHAQTSSTPPVCLCCWGGFSVLCCLIGPQNRVGRGLRTLLLLSNPWKRTLTATFHSQNKRHNFCSGLYPWLIRFHLK